MSRRMIYVAVALIALAVVFTRSSRSHREDVADGSSRARNAAHGRADHVRADRREAVAAARPGGAADDDAARGDVTVTVAGTDGKPRDDATVELRGVDPRSTTAAGGVAAFAHVAAGRYEIAAWATGTAKAYKKLVVRDGSVQANLVLVAGAAAAGRVIDERGNAVAGAIVVAAPVVTWTARVRTHDPVMTGRDGTFRFDALPAGPFRFRASHAKLAPASSETISLDGATARDGITIAMAVGVTVRGRVVDRAHTAIADARVLVAADDGAIVREARSDAGGGFELRGIPMQQVSALAIGERGTSSPVAVDAARAEPAAVELVIDQLGTIGGVVVDGAGGPLAGIHVRAEHARAVTDGDGRFTLAGLADGDHTVIVAGQRRGTLAHTGQTDVQIVLAAAHERTGDSAAGRTLAGVVLAGGHPVANATVSASASQLGPRTSTTTTDESGTFTLSGLPGGELAVVAAEAAHGRSKALRVSPDPAEPDIVLELQPSGALSGVLRRNDAPAEGVTVTAQSTTAPNAVFTVASGRDGRYRFDELAPDTYKVSATLGTPRAGMRLYSKQVDVPSGGETTADLAVEPGAITLVVTAAPRAGTLGGAGAWVISGSIAASSAAALATRMAAQGASDSQWIMIRSGAPAQFVELAPGDYTACVVPLPASVHGIGSIAYMEQHADKLPAFCQAIAIAPAPATQRATVAVDIPP